jgi:hypothetical protein
MLHRGRAHLSARHRLRRVKEQVADIVTRNFRAHVDQVTIDY